MFWILVFTSIGIIEAGSRLLMYWRHSRVVAIVDIVKFIVIVRCWNKHIVVVIVFLVILIELLVRLFLRNFRWFTIVGGVKWYFGFMLI
jgi:hypothetical protein